MVFASNSVVAFFVTLALCAQSAERCEMNIGDGGVAERFGEHVEVELRIRARP